MSTFDLGNRSGVVEIPPWFDPCFFLLFKKFIRKLKEKINLKVNKELKKVIIREAENKKLSVDELVEQILIQHLEK